MASEAPKTLDPVSVSIKESPKNNLNRGVDQKEKNESAVANQTPKQSPSNSAILNELKTQSVTERGRHRPQKLIKREDSFGNLENPRPKRKVL